jgi:predicted nucleic acid-binding protein
MTVRFVVDTNVLLYAVSGAAREQKKRALARDLLAQADWGTTTQVLQEFYVNATRVKSGSASPSLAAEAAEAMVLQLMRRPVAVTDTACMKHALALKTRYHISYWDAAVIAGALSIGAPTLYTEDLNHGQAYEGLTVINPFI